MHEVRTHQVSLDEGDSEGREQGHYLNLEQWPRDTHAEQDAEDCPDLEVVLWAVLVV